MELLNWVKRAQAGDEQAVHDLCLQFTGLVKKYAFAPHIRPIAEEAQSQGWLAVVQSINQYDGYRGVQFAGYVESRVKYAIWNLFKKERRRWQNEGQLEGSQEEDGLTILDRLAADTDVESEVELRYLSRELMAAVALLPAKQQQVILRTVMGDEGLTQMATELGISAQGVYNLRKRGLARLKRLCSGMYRDIRH